MVRGSRGDGQRESRGWSEGVERMVRRSRGDDEWESRGWGEGIEGMVRERERVERVVRGSREGAFEH